MNVYCPNCAGEEDNWKRKWVSMSYCEPGTPVIDKHPENQNEALQEQRWWRCMVCGYQESYFPPNQKLPPPSSKDKK